MRISDTILRVPYPVWLDRKTIRRVKDECDKEGEHMPFSTMLRMLILEALKARESNLPKD